VARAVSGPDQPVDPALCSWPDRAMRPLDSVWAEDVTGKEARTATSATSGFAHHTAAGNRPRVAHHGLTAFAADGLTTATLDGVERRQPDGGNPSCYRKAGMALRHRCPREWSKVLPA